MTTLPFPPRRSHLRAFWLGLHGVALAASALVALGLGMGRAGVALAVFFAVTLAAGLRWSEGPLALYRAWHRTGKAVARIGQWWTLAVTYYLLFAVTGRAGARLDLGPPSGSTWQPYASGDATGNGTREPAGGWVGRFVREARHPRRTWWLAVLPCLVILSLFTDDARGEDVPSNIYTLY